MSTLDLSSELSYKAVRGGGPGGQHVNKTSTKVEVRWDLWASPSFTEEEKMRLSAKLSSRLTQAGELILTDHSSRSQAINRELVTARLYQVLEDALKVQKPRRKTRPSAASRAKRLQAKRYKSSIKSGRGRINEL